MSAGRVRVVFMGYLDSQAVRPGQMLTVRASGRGRARVRQLVHSDPSAGGPGVISIPCDWGRAEIDTGSVETPRGSWAAATDALPHAFTLSCWLWPTDLSNGVVVASWTGASSVWRLEIVDGLLRLTDGTRVLASSSRIRERDWHFVGVAVGAESATVFSAPWGRTGGPFVASAPGMDARAEGSGDLVIGGIAPRPKRGDLDGRIAGLRVHAGELDIVELMDLMNGMGIAALCEWDLGDRRDPDVLPGRVPLLLHQSPTRSAAVPPPAQSAGRPLVAPGSVHFHRDDIEDCEWPVGVRITVPDDTKSGIYCVTVDDGSETFELPFVVVGSGDVTLLVPTLTWQAYANLGRDPRTWPGRSHYSLHSDGSPVVLTTAWKPSQTCAPSARLEVDGGDGFAEGQVLTHLLMADLHVWYWLSGLGLDPAALDDRTLHEEGAEALKDAKVLVLSAHPEYWTSSMLDALDAYLQRGGNLVYLGGNGLYWVTSLHPTKAHVMEVRRWGGSQTCSVEPGDRRHQLEDVAGGLWEESGRPPDDRVAVGFAGFGAGSSLEYRRTSASHDDAWAWIFDGVNGETFGGNGINVGAGNEFDSHRGRGPGESTILASALPSTPDHFGVFERGAVRAPADELRADMVITRTPAGGWVFSASAITVTGCLVATDEANGMQRVCSNVILGMLNGR